MIQTTTTSAGIVQNPLLPGVLSKYEAIKTMSQGKKVTHRYFRNNEWMTLTATGMYLFEDGVVYPSFLFWKYRQGEYWETGWSLYGAYNPDIGCQVGNLKK